MYNQVQCFLKLTTLLHTVFIYINSIPEALTVTVKLGMFNVAVRILLKLPYTAHTWLQAPLIRQQHIRLQLYIRNDKMLWYASRMNDNIIKTCINRALYNSNSCIGYRLAFYRHT